MLQAISRMLPFCVLNVKSAALHNKLAGNSYHTVVKHKSVSARSPVQFILPLLQPLYVCFGFYPCVAALIGLLGLGQILYLSQPGPAHRWTRQMKVHQMKWSPWAGEIPTMASCVILIPSMSLCACYQKILVFSYIVLISQGFIFFRYTQPDICKFLEVFIVS